MIARIAVPLAILLAGSGTAPAPTQLKLEDCLRIALSNSTQVLKSQNNLELSGEAVLQSYAQFLPTVDASAGAAYSWGTQYYTFTAPTLVTSKTLAAQYQISTTLNLFNGLADRAAFRAASLRQDSARMSLVWAKQQVATDVTQSYYQILLDRRILDIDRKNFQEMRDREKLLHTELEVGSASVADASQQSAQAALASSSVVAAQQKLQDDSVLLIQKLRLDPSAQYELADLDPSVGAPQKLAPEPELAQAALESRADLKASLSLSRWATEEVSVARGDYLPKLGLGFTLLGAGTTLYSQYVDGANNLPVSQPGLLSQLGNQVDYSVLLTLTWNILDHGLTRYNVSQARVAAENSEIDYEDARLAVLSQIHQVYGDYQAALTALTAAEQARVASDRAYRVISGRYKVGASSFVDLITAQAGLVQAQSTEAQARIALGFQLKLVELYEGRTPITI